MKKLIYQSDFGRVGAQAAKQALLQRLREAEKEILYKEYIEHEGENSFQEQ